MFDEGITIKSGEIKSGITINPAFFKGLNFYNKLSNTTAENSFLVYGGDKNYKRKEAQVVSWRNTTKLIA